MKLSITSLSIKQKLISTMALSSLALCGGFGYALVDRFEDAETKNLYNVEIPSVMYAVDTKVESEISQLIHASEFLAKSPFVEKEFNTGVSQETELMIETMLKDIALQYGFTDASLINYNSNRYWNQNGFLKVLTPEEDSWYFQSKGTKQGVEVSTFTESDGTAKVFVNYHNTDKGVISATSKTLKEIEEFLGEFSITGGTKVYLTDSDGVVKAHPDRSLIDKSDIKSLYQTTVESLFSKNESKITTLVVSDEDKIIATSYIDALGWYVVVDIPKDEAFALVDDAKTSMILVTALVALLATLFSVFIANSIVRPIDSLTKVFKDIGSGEGDLTTRIPVKGDDEIAALSSGFNSFIESIHSSVKMVAETSAQLATAASSVDGHSKKTLDLCDHQSDITTHTVTAINEMGATVNEIASNASVAAEQAAEAESQSSEGEKIVISTKETANKLSEEIAGISTRMDTLAENTNSIESILDVIRGISEQTNLLALNAAIEAARAGEHGRGFAVVADEVRTLASRTNSSIDDIQGMISSLQKEASLAVESIEAGRETTLESTASSEAAREAISIIAKSISEISSVNYQVAAATEEQSTVVDELNRKVDEINQITQDNRNTASELSQSSSELRELSTKLNELVSRFKI